jgi:hypothetical protein
MTACRVSRCQQQLDETCLTAGPWWSMACDRVMQYLTKCDMCSTVISAHSVLHPATWQLTCRALTSPGDLLQQAHATCS